MMNEINFNSELSQYEQLSLAEIVAVLRRFGIYRHYKGSRRLAYAVYLVLENECRLEAVVKEIYMPVAEKFHCSWGAVERCLRVAVSHAWVKNYDELCEIAGTKLKLPPTPAELLDIFAVYIKYHTAIQKEQVTEVT